MSSIDAKYNGEIFRKDHPQILASRRDLASIKGVQLDYDAAGYLAGQVLGIVTATGNYKSYDPGASDGSEVAVGILMFDKKVEDFVDASDSQGTQMIVGGEVYKDKLTGLDAAAETAMGARTMNINGEDILKF